MCARARARACVCVFVCVCVREKERERQRDRERERGREGSAVQVNETGICRSRTQNSYVLDCSLKTAICHSMRLLHIHSARRIVKTIVTKYCLQVEHLTILF